MSANSPDRGEAPSMPKSFVAQFWQLFGLKKRDTLTALFALPAGVQVLTQLYDSLHLSDLLRRFIRVWREVTRELWEQAVAYLNSIFSWRLEFTPAEMDALTLACLAGGAALTSSVFKRGESLERLRERAVPYRLSVKLSGATVIVLVYMATAAMFLTVSDSDFLFAERRFLLFQVLGTLLGGVLVVTSGWWAIHRDGRKIDAAAEALLCGHFLLARSHVARFRRAIEREWRKQKFAGKSPLETLAMQDVPALVGVMRSWYARQVRQMKWMMPGIFFLLLLTVFQLSVVATGNTETAVTYIIALAALMICTVINWKAFPIIYVNVFLITLLNYGTLALTPAVQHLDGLIRQAGG